MIYTGEYERRGKLSSGRNVTAQTECSTAHPALQKRKALWCLLSPKDFLGNPKNSFPRMYFAFNNLGFHYISLYLYRKTEPSSFHMVGKASVLYLSMSSVLLLF